MLVSKPGSFSSTVIERDVVDIVFFHANSILGVFTAVMEKDYKENYFSFRTHAMTFMQN